MDSAAYAIAYNVIYNRIKNDSNNKIIKIVVQETKL